MLFIVECSMNGINISVISDDNDLFIQILLPHLCIEDRLLGTCHVTMEATSKERKSADNCSPPQGYRLSTALADHILSGCRYLTYKIHLSQLSIKVNARCNLHRRLAGTTWGAHFYVLQTSTTGFAT